MTDAIELRDAPVRLDRFGAFVWRNGERMREREGAAPYTEADLDGHPREYFLCERDKKQPVCGVLGEAGVRFCAVEWHAVLYVDRRLWVFEDRGNVQLDAAGFVIGYDIETTVFDAANRPYTMRAVTDWHGHGTVTMVLVEPDGTVWRAIAGFGRGAGHEVDSQAVEPALNLRGGMPLRDDEEDTMALYGETRDEGFVVIDTFGVTIYPADPSEAVATFPLDGAERGVAHDGGRGEAQPEATWAGNPRAANSSEAHAQARAWREAKGRSLVLAGKGPGTEASC